MSTQTVAVRMLRSNASVQAVFLSVHATSVNTPSADPASVLMQVVRLSAPVPPESLRTVSASAMASSV